MDRIQVSRKIAHEAFNKGRMVFLNTEYQPFADFLVTNYRGGWMEQISFFRENHPHGKIIFEIKGE